MMMDFNLQLIERIIFITIIIIIYQTSFINCSFAMLGDFESCLEEFGFEGGNVIQRSNTSKEYKELNEVQWNTNHGIIYPLGYLLPMNSKDVQISIICARKYNVRIVAKCGGHGFTKYAFGNSASIVIDLQRLNMISIDKVNKIGLIGGGVKIGELIYKLWKGGKYITPTGMCPHIGIAGYALGGGYGYLTRTHGLSSDNIIEMEFVDANGSLLILNSNNEYSDLFWALRGGGSGSFGIVTSFKFKLHVAPIVVYAQLHYDHFSVFPNIFSTWNSFFKSNPPSNFNSQMSLVNNTITLDFADLQDYATSTKDRGRALRNILSRFPTPNSISIETFDYSEFVVKIALNTQCVPSNTTLLSELAHTRFTQTIGLLHVKSFFIQKILNETEISGFYQLLTKTLANLSDLQVHLVGLGGVPNQISPIDTSFVHRGPTYKYTGTIFGTTSPSKSNPNWKGFKKMRSFFKESISILHHKESYQNYIDEEMENYLERYYGVNLNRLITIKNKYDPDNYFHNPQSIPLHYHRRNQLY